MLIIASSRFANALLRRTTADRSRMLRCQLWSFSCQGYNIHRKFIYFFNH